MTTLPHSSSHGDWNPQHSWNAGSTSIGGTFEDGTRVDLVTHHDSEYRVHQRAAWNEWLHGRVLVVNRNSAPVLVLPVDHFTESAIKVAVTAWATGHGSTAA